MDLWNQFLREIRASAPEPLDFGWLKTLKQSELELVEQWEKAYMAGRDDMAMIWLKEEESNED